MSQDPLALLATLLQLLPPWTVTGYQLDPLAKTLHITLQWPSQYCPVCPVCNEPVPTHDHRAARYWQHLSCMGYRTELSCKLPRARCPTHGVHSGGGHNRTITPARFGGCVAPLGFRSAGRTIVERGGIAGFT